MTAFRNLGFETIGATTGAADGWAYTFLAQVQAIAPISPLPARPEEDFERGWSIDSYVDAFTDDDLVEAQYGSPPLLSEGFEAGWSSNENYKTALIGLAAATYGTNPDSFDDFENGWGSNELADFAWADVVAETAQYGSGFDLFESFESEWNSNEANLTAFAGPDLLAASYATGGEGVSAHDFEDFEVVRDDVLFTADPGIDTLTAAGHGFANGNRIMLFAGTGGALPAGLNSGIFYFVVGVATNTFQVAATSGGSAVDFTGPGFGPMRARTNLACRWATRLGSV